MINLGLMLIHNIGTTMLALIVIDKSSSWRVIQRTVFATDVSTMSCSNRWRKESLHWTWLNHLWFNNLLISSRILIGVLYRIGIRIIVVIYKVNACLIWLGVVHVTLEFLIGRWLNVYWVLLKLMDGAFFLEVDTWQALIIVVSCDTIVSIHCWHIMSYITHPVICRLISRLSLPCYSGLGAILVHRTTCLLNGNPHVRSISLPFIQPIILLPSRHRVHLCVWESCLHGSEIGMLTWVQYQFLLFYWVFLHSVIVEDP